MTDIKVLLMTLLEGDWGVDFTPQFSTDWYEAKQKMPQVVVSHVLTQPRFMGFHEDLPNQQRRVTSTYAIDVWSKGDQEKRHRMIEEVDRIIQSKCSDPGGGLDFIETSNWRDIDEGETHPRLYRSRLRLEVRYYK